MIHTLVLCNACFCAVFSGIVFVCSLLCLHSFCQIRCIINQNKNKYIEKYKSGAMGRWGWGFHKKLQNKKKFFILFEIF